MSDTGHRPSRSIWGAVILIALGAILLLANLAGGFNPWTMLARYWPLILIFLGVGGIIDYFRVRSDPSARPVKNPGAAIALLVLAIVLAFAIVRGRSSGRYLHDGRSIDIGGATSVRAHIEMPAGNLAISSGGLSLLDAQFDYASADGDPQIDYNVSGTQGEMKITQTQPPVHFGDSNNSWRLDFANSVPLDLSLEMGAGQGDLDLGALDLTKLKIELGAGQLNLNLRGARTNDLDATIEGGVGQATVRLPSDVGVRVHVDGGLGSVSAHGLTREGDDYVNDALGKSPATIRLTVDGGVGSIDLDAAP